MRRGEALHLQWRHVGADEIGILSEEGARTKSGRWRSIPLADGARQSLEALRTGGDRYVLPQLAPASMSRAFSRTIGRAGLDGSIHCLRHTYCSHLVQAGVPLRTVQVLAGHASYTTTERYAHLAPSTLRDSIARLSL
jgi:integrase